jgi:MFS family permease
MGFLAVLRHLLRGARFRELFVVRVTSQFGDGVFQIALASFLLFAPEKHADAASIAAALAAVLLPFSVIGPFAGVFLDRFDRRLILARFNVVRAVPTLATAAVVAVAGTDAGAATALVYALVIIAFGLNRFLLSGLSAALPRVVDPADLLMANAVTPTSGTISYMCGLAVGAGLREVPLGLDSDAAVIVGAAVLYAAAGMLALRLPPAHLGPDVAEPRPNLTHELAEVVRGLVAGVRHLNARRPAGLALAAIGLHRFWYGLTTVATILLYRNTFEPGDGDAAFAALSIAVLAAGIGYFAAAFATPVATTRLSPRQWIVALLIVAAVVEVFPTALYTQQAIVIAAFFLGLSAQGVKICVDTLVQRHVDDSYRGRVFSIYDVLFNVAFVIAAIAAAFVVPTSGESYPLLVVCAIGYLSAAAAYAPLSRQADSGRVELLPSRPPAE